MREVDVKIISESVKDLCIKANMYLPDSLKDCIKCAYINETSELPKSIMGDISDNLNAAVELNVPICQDTGMAVIFLEIGQDVHLIGGDLYDAVNRGVRMGYVDGYLRCSVVFDPLNRVNTNDNTPAVIHTKIVPGEKISITVAPKGFGSENMSVLKMFTPAINENDIIDYVIESVKKAGSMPCPPIVFGIGIGGDFEHCAYLAKKALCRDVSIRNENEYYKKLEERVLKEINKLDIGPSGFGGKTTALCVNIEYAPTHIAGLPVAINFGCHVTRHANIVI